jgi:uncharacterized protein YndB with AHSA1/START domain
MISFTNLSIRTCPWFGPKAFDACEVEADVRVGGRFAFRMTSSKGTYGARVSIARGRRD